MKKLLSVFISFIFVMIFIFSSVPAASANGSIPGGYTGDCYWFYSAPLLCIQGTGYMDGYHNDDVWDAPWGTEMTKVQFSGKIKNIGAASFFDCKKLMYVTMPEETESIDAMAFCNCVSLESIELPNTIKIIDDRAFEGCESLKEIDLPDCVEKIGDYAFANCYGLTSADISDSCKSMTSHAFCGCINLENVHIGNSLEEIGWYAFCGSKIRTIELPDSLKLMYYNTFSGCDYLESIKIPKNVSKIYGSQFTACDALGSITVDENNTAYDSRDNCNAIIDSKTNTLISGCKNSTVPDTVEEIGEEAFYEISNGDWEEEALREIVIPKSVRKIGKKAFCACVNLKSVVLNEGLKEIGEDAFSFCGDLKEIFIPDSVRVIGDRALGMEYDTENWKYVPDPDFIIYGYEGSAAEKYAEENGIKFTALPNRPAVLLGDADDNSRVEVSDVSLLQRNLCEMDTGYLHIRTSDVDADSDVSIADASIIQKYLSDNPVSFPVGQMVD